MSRDRFGWILFWLFLLWLGICIFFNDLHKSPPKPIPVHRMSGTRTVAGKFEWVKPVDDGFEICVRNPIEGRVVANINKKTLVIYQNHDTHERVELKADQVCEWVKNHRVENAMVGMYKSVVSDVILFVPADFREE